MVRSGPGIWNTSAKISDCRYIYRCDSYMKTANFTHNLGLFDAVDGVLPNGVSLSARPTPL